jgi:hypothetical protein
MKDLIGYALIVVIGVLATFLLMLNNEQINKKELSNRPIENVIE